MHAHAAHLAEHAHAPLWLLMLAAAALALAAAPLGAALLWRRMAYFGDALSHAALFGVAFALAAALPPMLGVGAVALLVALLIVWMRRRSGLAADALLGAFAHGLLAAGLVVAFAFLGPDIDLHGVLFGDVLAMTPWEALVVIAGSVIVLALLLWHWRALVLLSLSEELALAEGWPVRRVQVLVVIAAAIMLALAARTTGLLLYTAMLVIPPAAARALAREPEHMAAGAALIGASCVLIGIPAARALHIPSGALIVALAFAVFVVFHLARWLRG